jgi:molybdate transport system substrate-binding protein
MPPRNRNLFLFLYLFLFLSLFASCASPPASPTLTVFAAASLTDAFTQIGKDFEASHPGVTVVFNFAGSQALRTQLEQGAVADVFASASGKEMTAAITAGLVVSGTEQNFLANQLVLILPGDNPGDVQKLEDLARPGLRLVLAAEGVPVGDYAREALGKMETSFGVSFRDAVLTNVVSSEDNVKQVVAKVQLGEADAGIVYGSDAVARPELLTLAIPAEFNVLAQYPIAPLAAAPQPTLAADFIAYMLSAEGQATLSQWGFMSVSP